MDIVEFIDFKRDGPISGYSSINVVYESFMFVVKINKIAECPRFVVRNKITGNWSASRYLDVVGNYVRPAFADPLNNVYTLLIKEEQWQKYKTETIVLIAKINLIENVFMADIITHMKNML